MSKEADEVKGLYFPVLNHGFVALVDYMGDDAAVVQAARVSYGAGTKSVNEDRGVLRYLMRHRHTTPFEMVELKFHVKLPIFVARQLIRHRMASVNEYSLRYSLPAMQFYIPEPEQLSTQSKKNKQGRADPVDQKYAQEIRGAWLDLNRQSRELYELCVGPDVDLARELARLHLPLSIYTEWYWKIDLHNLLHFLGLRCEGHAQWEIREVANIKAAITQRVAPKAFEAWADYRFQARTFSRIEMQLIRRLLRVSLLPDGHRILVESDAEGVYESEALAAGLSRREVDELLAEFIESALDRDAPVEFPLDLSKAKTAEYFAAEAAKYLPATV